MLSKFAVLICIFVTFIFSLTILTSSLADSALTREMVDLNGTWYYVYSSVESIPETGWAEVKVPSFVSWQMDEQKMCYNFGCLPSAQEG